MLFCRSPKSDLSTKPRASSEIGDVSARIMSRFLVSEADKLVGKVAIAQASGTITSRSQARLSSPEIGRCRFGVPDQTEFRGQRGDDAETSVVADQRPQRGELVRHLNRPGGVAGGSCADDGLARNGQRAGKHAVPGVAPGVERVGGAGVPADADADAVRDGLAQRVEPSIQGGPPTSTGRILIEATLGRFAMRPCSSSLNVKWVVPGLS